MTEFRKVTAFKTVAEFRDYLASEGIDIGLVDNIPGDGRAAMAQPISCLGRELGNRWAILPMEGWDCLDDGTPSEFTRRRWLRFATSGAKLIYGTEAAAVMHSGRSNPQQLLIAEHSLPTLRDLCAEMRSAHRERFGRDDDLLIGLQLTHSGRYSHPNDAHTRESVTAYAHPLLDKKFNNSAANVVSDEGLRDIIAHFIRAAEYAAAAGFDFVDIKLAHGYLGHELLTAHERPGDFGGSFANRTRFFREIADGIRQRCPQLGISARVSLFDTMPFEKGPDNVGRPMAWDSENYPYAFGGDGGGMAMDPDLRETVLLMELLRSYGAEMICATIGSPYYNPHMQRPAYYPVSDGYLMPEHPLYNVSRHILAVKRIKELCPWLQVVGAGYTCLQEYLPHAAEYAVAQGMTDFVGIGRMVLSYPDICADVLAGCELDRRRICRTFGDCTNAPRAGMISGCYPLDEFYKQRPEAIQLKEIKKTR
jgi:NADPH2 dehydrogenase